MVMSCMGDVLAGVLRSTNCGGHFVVTTFQYYFYNHLST